MQLTRKEMLGYGLGDTACGLIWNSVVMFLMFFYTDVLGISVAQAGLLLLLARVADGFWDCGVGLWVDRTHSRHGRCRPFLLYGTPLLAVLAVACFYVPPLSPQGKLVYAYVTYIGLMLTYSVVNLPYAALLAQMTADTHERTRASGVRMACATVGWMVVSGLTMPLVAWIGGGDATQGYFKTVAIYALIAVALLYACFASTRERVLAKPSPAKPWADFKLLLGSRAWNILALHSMVMYLSLLMPIGAAMYFLIYVVKAPALAPLYFLLGNVGNLVGVLVSDRLTRRFCKLQVLRTCAWIAALALLGFLWIDTGSLWQVFGLAFLVAALCFVGAPITMSMSADVADSIELSSGRRIVGLASSALSLAVKVGMGLGSAVTGAVLSYTGYQAGVDQSPQAVHGILMCMGLGPAVAMALVALVLQAYPLNRTRLSQMQADLALRRAAA